MSEHVHEWRHFNRDIPFLCRKTDCKATMDLEEAERRLNATEMLSADMAMWIADNWGDLSGPMSDAALRAYAAALEPND